MQAIFIFYKFLFKRGQAIFICRRGVKYVKILTS